MLLIVGFSLVLLATCVWMVAAKKGVIKGLPWHSEHVFFWGSLLHAHRVVLRDKTAMPLEILKEHRRHDFSAFGLAFPGGLVIVLLVDPRDIRCLLKESFLNFEKGGNFCDIFSGLLGSGIFNVNGAEWKSQRAIASHLFNRRQLRDRMSNVFGIHAQQLANVIRQRSEGGAGVEVKDHFYHFTFDSINSIAFNRHVASQSGNAADCAFQDAFDVCQQMTATRFIKPWWRVNRLFQLSEEERAMKRGLKTIDEYVYNVVDDYLDAVGNVHANHVADDQTLTGLFLRYAQEEGLEYSRGFVRDLILNFVIAGRDTTASALTSCIEFLTEEGQEHWQDKLVDEACRCFAGHKSQPLTFDDIVDCSPVSEAVFLEALRLHPSVPSNEKMCVKETKFPSGITVPAGTVVNWSTISTNRIPAVWGSNADDFDPNRWLTEGNTITTKYDEYSYPTFNAGPRLCLGRNMAILEGKIALLTLFAQFRFSRKTNPPVPINSVTWQIPKGFEVFVHPVKEGSAGQ